MKYGNEKDPISLRRGLEILRVFQIDEGAISNNQLCERTGLPKSTIARFTATFVKLGYLRQDEPFGRYHLTDKTVHLGRAFLDNMPICRVAQPLMQAFADKLSVSVALGMGERASIVCIVCCQGLGTIARRVRPGALLPMGETAIGGAFLAALPPARRAWHLAEIAAASGDAADERIAAIERNIEEIRQSGFCHSEGASSRDDYMIGAPVVLNNGDSVLALGCLGRSHEMNEPQVLKGLGSALRDLSTKIANAMSDLGYSLWDD